MHCCFGTSRTVLIWTTILPGFGLFDRAILAQSGAGTGRIEGTVLDSSGAVVPGAEVSVQNEQTGVSTGVTSEADGHFLVLYLPPAPYTVTTKKAGFTATEIPHVQVSVGTTSQLQPKLNPGSVSVTVTVDDQPPLVDPTQSAISTVVGQREIESLPLNGRNFTDFEIGRAHV